MEPGADLGTGLDPALGLALHLALAALLLAAARHKLRDAGEFAATLAGYGVLPRRWAGPAARGLPFAEGLAGLALLASAAGTASSSAAAIGAGLPSGAAIPSGSAVRLAVALGSPASLFSTLSALVAAGLLALYTGAVAVALVRGRRGLPCGCGGPAGGAVLGPGLLARNAVLVGLALAAALPPAPRALVWVDAATVAGTVAALGLLHAAAGHLIANGPPLRALRRPPSAAEPAGATRARVALSGLSGVSALLRGRRRPRSGELAPRLPSSEGAS